jgi:DNA-binding HxlR family transcriptional regulator
MQFCGVAKALDVVGERWTLLLVRDLLLGGRRFTDLLEGLPGLTTNLLAKRLADLEAAGLVEKRRLPPPASSTVYALTDAGRDLEPVVLALGAFGERYLSVPGEDDRTDIRWAMVSMKRRYRGGVDGLRAELRLGERRFALRLREDGIDVRDGPVEEADLRLAVARPDALPRWLTRRDGLRALVDDGAFLLEEGRRQELSRFSRAFGLRP